MIFVLVSVLVEQQQKVRKIALDQLGNNFIFLFTVEGKLFWEEQNVLYLKKTNFQGTLNSKNVIFRYNLKQNVIFETIDSVYFKMFTLNIL